MTIRERVEGVAAYYAAENITPEGRKELRDILDLQDFYFSREDAERITALALRTLRSPACSGGLRVLLSQL